MSHETTSPTLLERVCDLDNQVAWREFDERYRELILRYVQRRGLQPADAEDVRQEVMLTLARNLRRFEYREELGRFRDYLRTIVRNAIWKRFSRQDPVRGARSLDGIDPTEAAEDDEDWETEWMLHHFRLAMGLVRRSFHDRSLVIFEGLLEGRTPEDLARSQGTTVANVYKIKQRVRDRLQSEVKRQIDEEEFAERRK